MDSHFSSMILFSHRRLHCGTRAHAKFKIDKVQKQLIYRLKKRKKAKQLFF